MIPRCLDNGALQGHEPDLSGARLTRSAAFPRNDEYWHAVEYFRSSGLDGNPDSGTFAVTDIQVPDLGLAARFEIRGLGHVCDGCSNPEHGGTFEQRWFMEMLWTLNDWDVAFRVGESTNQPYRLVIVEDAPNDIMELTVNGRLGVSQTDNACSFDAYHDTVSPIVVRGIDSDRPEFLAGELDISDRDGAWAHRVKFDGGNVYIDGNLVRLEDLDECDFES